MKTLKQYFAQAAREGWAVPHFNFSNLEQLQAIVEAAKEMRAPVLVGTSESERAFIGIEQAVSLVKSLQKQGIAVFLNADHCRTIESAKEAINAGYDSVHIDLSKKSFAENVKGTAQVVKYAAKKVQVEGELGYLVTDSSKVYKEKIVIPEESYTKVEEAKRFVRETGIDRLAPAIGTIHGISENKLSLRLDLARELSKALGKDVTLVLHGGSGVSEKDIKDVIKAGFSNIHVSTELRVAYTNALRKALKEAPEESTPYKYLHYPKEAVVKLVKSKMRLFRAENVL